MCGITGIFNFNGERPQEAIIKAMTKQLAHRGPNGEGIYLDKGIALGHRRLAILDISTNGSQPMRSKNGEWMIVFNGCIYNYIELRSELKSKGHQFISTSDTEVVCEGLAAYGIEIFERFNGMFAIAAWHIPSETLYLTRDRYGIKPLYYCEVEGTILFASEIKAFLKYPKFKVELNYSALNEYFTFQNLFSFDTLFKNVQMLPPASLAKINAGQSRNIKPIKWWDYFNCEQTHSETMHIYRRL